MPHVSLSYNSQRGESYMGVGFRISNLHEIRRCVAPYAAAPLEGPNRAINLTSTDHLCLDGQSLILVSGTAWEEGAEYRPIGQPLTKIIEHNSVDTEAMTDVATSFTVHRPDGAVETYGLTHDALLFASDDGGTGTGTSPPVAWALEQTVQNGNAIHYSYQSGGGLDFIPQRIDYGMTTPRLGSSPPPIPFSIVFNPGFRPTQTKYQAGYRYDLTTTIMSIDVLGPKPNAVQLADLPVLAERRLRG
jgi:hypothetical protein